MVFLFQGFGVSVSGVALWIRNSLEQWSSVDGTGNLTMLTWAMFILAIVTTLLGVAGSCAVAHYNVHHVSKVRWDDKFSRVIHPKFCQKMTPSYFNASSPAILTPMLRQFWHQWLSNFDTQCFCRFNEFDTSLCFMSGECFSFSSSYNSCTFFPRILTGAPITPITDHSLIFLIFCSSMCMRYSWVSYWD